MKKTILMAALALSGQAVAATLTVGATAYTLTGKTSTGSHTHSGVVAISRDLYPLYVGKRLKIVRVYKTHGCGLKVPPRRTYVITDKMGAGISRKIDIWVPGHSQATNIGRCKLKVRIY